MENGLKMTISKDGWSAQILLLTWVAGSVDAIGYLGLGHVFTANMTGNTVLLGLALGQGQGLAAIRSLFALAGFILGAAIGALLVHVKGTAVDVRRALIGPVLAEAAILTVFALTWHLPMLPRSQGIVHLLIVLSAVAMGIQSAAVQRLHLPGIATTVITSTIASLIGGLVKWLHLAYASPASDGRPEEATGRERHLGLQAGVFLVYGAAAAASGISQQRLPVVVGLSPLLAIALVLAGISAYGARPKIT